MKNSICAIGFLACMLFIGCEETAEQKIKNVLASEGYATQELKDAQIAYIAKCRRFKRASQNTLKANEIRINAFKEKMEQAGPRFKARYYNEAAVLEERKRTLKKKLGEYRDGGPIKWEEFRTNFNDDIDGVGRSMTVLYRDDH